MATVIAVTAALGAACCFALAAVVQHGAARETGEKLLSLRLLLVLARNPRWLAGVTLGVLSFAIQALALAFGPLALVQPLAATDVLFALPMIAVAHRYRLTRGDWLGAGAVAGGIALFLAVSPPSEGTRAPGLAAWAPVIVATGAFAAVAGLAAMRARGTAQVALLAAGAGITYGVVDALTKSTVDLLADRGSATILRWEPYALLAAGILGTLLSQSAFRAGALSVSLPVIDTLEPISAVVIGAFVFGEQLAASPGQLAAQLAGGAVAAAGIAVLSRSSVAAMEAGPRDPAGGGAGHALQTPAKTLRPGEQLSFGCPCPGLSPGRAHQAAARSGTREPMARMVSGRSSRRPVQRCRDRQCLESAMACPAQVRRDDGAWRACSQPVLASGGVSLAGLRGAMGTWAGWSRPRPW